MVSYTFLKKHVNHYIIHGYIHENGKSIGRLPMNCIIVPPTPKAPNHYGAPNHHAWTGGNKCASSQAVWLIIVFLRLHRKKQIDSSWQNEFYICSICCGKSYFLSIYASQILRAAFSFECPGDLVNICVHLICPRQWVWPRKGPIALKPWLRPQDSPFFFTPRRHR